MDIPRRACPTLKEFEQEFLLPGRPVVLTGVVSQWPSWGQWSPQWFGQRYGQLRLSGNNSLQGRREVQVSEYLANLEHDPLYLDALPLDRLPGLRSDITIPPYCPADRHTEVLVWVGPSGTCLEFHKDNHTPLDGNQNLLAQLVGRKRVALVSPEHDARMYPAPQAANDYLRSQLRWEHPDPERFPLFSEVPVHETVVEPGDLLYIPAHWWHFVKSLEVSMTVTFWWRSSRLIELLYQFKAAAAGGGHGAFLAGHQSVLGMRDLHELGGPAAFQQLWQPLAPRVRELCAQMLDPELRQLAT